MTDVDVLIVGSGPAGAACALELCTLGLSVAMVEATHSPRNHLGETLPGKALVLLQRLGIDAAFRAQGHRASFAVRSAWGQSELSDRLSIDDPYGHGWHLDRHRFDQLLQASAENRGARILRGTRVTHFERHGDGWKVMLGSATGIDVIRAGFLIDATGRNAFLAHRLGMRSTVIDQLIGIGRLFEWNCTKSEPWTLVESIGSGWWYSVEVPGKKTLVVLMTDADLIAGRTNIERFWNAGYADSKHTQARLEGLTPDSQWMIQSAVSSVTIHDPCEPFLAIGDAAMSWDPLAGQGLTKALETGLAGAIAVLDRRNGSNSGSKRFSQAIEAEWRQYLMLRSEYYKSETRWMNSPFWKRRQVSETTGKRRLGLRPRDGASKKQGLSNTHLLIGRRLE